ncbi:MAG: helix-turn-helix domain-containing protein [DPANN group archaeon]|nr:helix-turn-helix domain-containing protein [DPANN group archaeon]
MQIDSGGLAHVIMRIWDDERALAVLNTLASKPHTLSDLVREIGGSKSNYHKLLSLMIFADLIRIEHRPPPGQKYQQLYLGTFLSTDVSEIDVHRTHDVFEVWVYYKDGKKRYDSSNLK